MQWYSKFVTPVYNSVQQKNQEKTNEIIFDYSFEIYDECDELDFLTRISGEIAINEHGGLE